MSPRYSAFTTEGSAAILDMSSVGIPFQVEEIFGDSRPIEVEIGAGRGRFSIDWATRFPTIGLIAVERARQYLRFAAIRATRANVGNIRLLHTTAEDLLFRCLSQASVQAVHIYFPDPWPKKRHHKRRFFQTGNLDRLVVVLRQGGIVRVKTDHPGYAGDIRTMLQAESRLQPIDLNAAFAQVVPTSYEIKYASEKRVVFRFALVKT